METTKIEFKGTKGGWFVEGNKWPVIESKNTDPDIVVTYPTIAVVNSTFRTIEEYTANAQLIASAPKLLEELQILVAHKDEILGHLNFCREGLEEEYEWMFENAESAISSALGE